MSETSQPPKKPENVWINIALNVAIPSVLLMKADDWLGLEPGPTLILALTFPIAYGIYDFISRKKVNFFSILGFISVLLTGGIGLLKLDTEYYAIKEAAIPAAFGIAVVLSLLTSKPLVGLFLFNEELFDVPKVNRRLAERGTEGAFKQLLVVCTRLLAISFIVSAILNYVLAKIIVKSPAGTDAFNDEVGKMTGLSYIVITVPTMAIMFYAMYLLFKGIKQHTGYELEEILQPHLAAKVEAADDKSETTN